MTKRADEKLEYMVAEAVSHELGDVYDRLEGLSGRVEKVASVGNNNDTRLSRLEQDSSASLWPHTHDDVEGKLDSVAALEARVRVLEGSTNLVTEELVTDVMQCRERLDDAEANINGLATSLGNAVRLLEQIQQPPLDDVTGPAPEPIPPTGVALRPPENDPDRLLTITYNGRGAGSITARRMPLYAEIDEAVRLGSARVEDDEPVYRAMRADPDARMDPARWRTLVKIAKLVDKIEGLDFAAEGGP